MQRREFVTLLGGAAAVWPLAAKAQQRAMPVVGFLDFGSPETTNMAAFRKGLSETGFIEGRNLAIEYRFAYNERDRLPELAADLVRRRVAVIAAWSGASVANAVKAATTTIPIVFQIGDDPVEVGLVASLNRSGGNVTGMTSMSAEIFAKRLELLHEMVPGAARIAVLLGEKESGAFVGPLLVKPLQAAAASIGLQIEVLTASTDREIDTAFTSLAQKRADALLVGSYALFANHHVQIVTLAARHAVPAAYSSPWFVEAGGLMSYGPKSYDDMAYQGGIYVGRILKGEKPADLPVMRPTQFELAILVERRPKLATTTLLRDFETGIEPVFLKPGDLWLLVDGHGMPRCVVRTTHADITTFGNVDGQFAWDEGEGDRTLTDWREGHIRYFTRQAMAQGFEFGDATQVVPERFTVIWPPDVADPSDHELPRTSALGHQRRIRANAAAAGLPQQPVQPAQDASTLKLRGGLGAILSEESAPARKVATLIGVQMTRSKSAPLGCLFGVTAV
jgi:putative ABC transport system substrate-binding protein